MALASTGVHVVEQAPKNGCSQGICPQSESQRHPASPGGLPKPAGGSDPGSFLITASAQGLTVCEILCVPFKSGVSNSHGPPGHSKVKPHWPSKPNILGACLPSAEALGWGPDMGLRPLASWGEPLQF